MANYCLNKVMLIGNLTRDPELRYTPQGVAVCSFGLATNRRWTTQAGERKESAQFHRIVAWNKLAELCSQLLVKGRRVYLEGRLQYREWVGNDGNKRRDAELVIEDMIILDSRQAGVERGELGAGKTIPVGEEKIPGEENQPILTKEEMTFGVTETEETIKDKMAAEGQTEASIVEPQEKSDDKALTEGKVKKERKEKSKKIDDEERPF